MNRAYAIAAGLLILYASFMRFKSPYLEYCMMLTARHAAVGLFAVWLWQRNKWMALFLVWAQISTHIPQPDLVAIVKPAPDKPTILFYPGDSQVAFNNVLGFILWYAILKEILKKEYIHYIYAVFVVIAAGNVIWLVLQYYNIDPLFHPLREMAEFRTGFMGQKNQVSALLAFTLPAFLRPKWWYLSPVLIPGFVLSVTVGGPLCAFVGLTFWCFTWNKYYGYGMLGIAFIGMAGFIRYIDQPNFHRVHAWIAGLMWYKEKWLTGYGLGHWKQTFLEHREYFKGWWREAHCEYIQGLYELGLPFPILLFGFLKDLLQRFNREAIMPMTALIIIAVHCSFNFALHIGPLALIVVTWINIYEVLCPQSQT